MSGFSRVFGIFGGICWNRGIPRNLLGFNDFTESDFDPPKIHPIFSIERPVFGQVTLQVALRLPARSGKMLVSAQAGCFFKRADLEVFSGALPAPSLRSNAPRWAWAAGNTHD